MINFFIKKDGVFTIDALLGISAFMMIVFLLLGIFIYAYPLIEISDEVSTLSRLANEQGGLRSLDVENFIQRLNDRYKFISDSDIFVTVQLVDSQGNEYLDVTPIGTEGDFYLKRDDLEVATLTVVTPSNNALIKAISFGMGGNTANTTYRFSRPVLSKRY